MSTGRLDYHRNELLLVRDPSHHSRLVPSYDCAGWKVLDVGCGMGQTLTAPEFSACSGRYGIDIDAMAIEEGQRVFPELVLAVAGAESTGLPDGFFDLVYSRVAIPYTNVPVAIRELHRVTAAGGQLWLALHDMKFELYEVRKAIQRRAVKRLLDRAYVLFNSLLLAVSGKCFKRPWAGTFESIQFTGSMTRLLKAAGFRDISVTRGAHYVITARKPVPLG